MATNSNITVLQKYATKYKNVVYGWDTSHPTTIPKKFIILIYHYLHAVMVTHSYGMECLHQHRRMPNFSHPHQASYGQRRATPRQPNYYILKRRSTSTPRSSKTHCATPTQCGGSGISI